MSDLPVNIDTTYADDGSDASVKDHQQHHDTLHALHNAIDGATPDPSSVGLQAHDADLDTIAAANNGSVLASTTASFTTADETKLDGIESNAKDDQTAADIRGLGFFDTTNDGTGSGLDADTVDGSHATALLSRTNHTGTQNLSTIVGHDKAAHDALNIDADTLDGNDATAFATSAQGSLADSATQPGDDADTLGSGTATANQILIADGSGNAAWGNAPGGLIATEVHTTNGSFTKGSYAKARGLRIRLVGGGGGGGGVSGGTGQAEGGGGGGAEHVEILVTDMTQIPSTLTVTIGTGGSGGAAGFNSGSAGNNSSVSGSGLTTITAAGGAGGIRMAVTTGNGAAAPGVGGGTSGTANPVAGIWVINIAGGGGRYGRVIGGISVLQNGGGTTVLSSSTNITANADGGAGRGFGGGGGGGNTTTATDRAGGGGSDGVCIIEVYG